MKIVLDTNVLLTSIGHHTPFRPIFDAIASAPYADCQHQYFT